MSDRIEHINDLIQRGFVKQRNQSLIIGNLYALITIVVVCIAVVLYTNYLRPIVEKSEMAQKKELSRAEQIALSHKLNSYDQNKTNENIK